MSEVWPEVSRSWWEDSDVSELQKRPLDRGRSWETVLNLLSSCPKFVIFFPRAFLRSDVFVWPLAGLMKKPGRREPGRSVYLQVPGLCLLPRWGSTGAAEQHVFAQLCSVSSVLAQCFSPNPGGHQRLLGGVLVWKRKGSVYAASASSPLL